MRTALDTNILSAIWSNEPTGPMLAHHLAVAQHDGDILISPFAYAECLAYPTATEDFIHSFLENTGVILELQLHTTLWTLAGMRFSQYAERRRASTRQQPRRMLPDYLIGAHALLHADRLMTLDTIRYQQDFPELRLYNFQGASD